VWDWKGFCALAGRATAQLDLAAIQSTAMARNWQYPRWRRLLMQSAMWVILGATVGLAALLDRHQHMETRVTLGSPVQCGGIQLQLPSHWMIESSDAGLITATFLGGFPSQHHLEVTVTPPAEPGLIDQLLQKENPGPPQAVTFGPAGSQAGSLYVRRDQLNQDGESFAIGRVVATTIFPNGPEVTIRLEHVDRNDQSMEFDDDIDLVRRIAATVQIAPSETAPD
jgi:hypothetical protein